MEKLLIKIRDNFNVFFTIVAVFSICVSLLTWALDLTHLVEQCIYCRSQRTVIGLIGLLMLAPRLPYVQYWQSFICYVFGYFGAHVASAQIFLNIRHHKVGIMFLLSSAALCWILFQTLITYWFNYKYKNNILDE